MQTGPRRLNTRRSLTRSGKLSKITCLSKGIGSPKRRKYDLRDIVNAIFWILRTGSQWRNLPDHFPKWQSVYYYFSKWKRDGTLVGLNSSLNMMLREELGKEATPCAVSIDSQSIKKAPFVSEATGIDGNKQVNGHRGADANGIFLLIPSV